MIVALAMFSVPIEANGQTTGSQFSAGFADLRNQVGPDIVGDCLDNEQRDLVAGTVRQHTTGGELAWNEVSGATSFTNGHETWLIGPHGLQRRLSAERFSWESDDAMALP